MPPNSLRASCLPDFLLGRRLFGEKEERRAPALMVVVILRPNVEIVKSGFNRENSSNCRFDKPGVLVRDKATDFQAGT